MPDLLQKIQTNSSLKPTVSVPPQDKTNTLTNEKKNIETQQERKDTFFNNKTILGSLLGLAAIGSGVWAIKSGKFRGNNNSLSISPEQINVKINDVLGEINQLKKLIKNDYTIKRQHIIEKFFNNEDIPENLRFHSGNELKLLITKNQEAIDKSKRVSVTKIEEQKHIIKDKFAKLIQDNEFNNLRKIRKSLIQTKKSAQTEDELMILNDKIAIVNNILIHKVYPEDSEIFAQLYNADSKTLLELVNGKYENYEQYIAKYKELNPIPSEFNFDSVEHSFYHSESLRFEDIFPKEAEIIKDNENLINKLNSKHRIFENLRNLYIEKLTELANKYKNSEAIRDLKNLKHQLDSLRRQLQSINRSN